MKYLIIVYMYYIKGAFYCSEFDFFEGEISQNSIESSPFMEKSLKYYRNLFYLFSCTDSNNTKKQVIYGCNFTQADVLVLS